MVIHRLHHFKCSFVNYSLSLFLLASITSSSLSKENFENKDIKPPAGYASLEAIKLAWLTGFIKTIDLELEVPDSIVVEKGIQYGQTKEKLLQLDLYSPKQLAKDAPGLIFVHGGAWKSGERNDYRYYCIKFAEQGYVVATISYRLIKDAPFPAAVKDAKCAVRWMRTNASKLKVDPNQIAMIGGSAGGHLAMMVGYSPDVPELEGQGGHQAASSNIQAVINLYGPSDLTTPAASKNKLVVNFLAGKSFEDSSEDYELASPVTHLTPDDPPTLIFHGTIDDIVSVTQSDALDQRLSDKNVPHEYHRLEGWPHTMDLAKNVNEFCFHKMLNFLKTHLSKP